MKISEVVKYLNKFKKDHGDITIEIFQYDRDMGQEYREEVNSMEIVASGNRKCVLLESK